MGNLVQNQSLDMVLYNFGCEVLSMVGWCFSLKTMDLDNSNFFLKKIRVGQVGQICFTQGSGDVYYLVCPKIHPWTHIVLLSQLWILNQGSNISNYKTLSLYDLGPVQGC